MDAGAVRFFVKYEQCCQIATRGPKNNMVEFLPVCNQKYLSEKSTRKLLHLYGPEEKSTNMGMEILEFAALNDDTRIFAETC